MHVNELEDHNRQVFGVSHGKNIVLRAKLTNAEEQMCNKTTAQKIEKEQEQFESAYMQLDSHERGDCGSGQGKKYFGRVA